MRGSVIATLLYFSVVLIKPDNCHAKLETINFVNYEISAKQQSEYSSLRDLPFPKYRSKGVPFLLLLRSVAAKLNVSVIVTKNWYDKQIDKKLKSNIEKSNELTIVATLSSLASDGYSPTKLWEKYTSFKQKPIFISTYNGKWNFIYCDLPRWKQEPVWSLKVFTSVLDNGTWICFAITFITLAFALEHKHIGNNLVLLLSSVLSGGLSGSVKQHKIIFVSWLLLIRVLVDIYSGGVSSRLISPPEEQALKTFADLDRNNFSAAVSGDYATPLIMEYITSMASNQTGTWINNGFLHLKNSYARQYVATASDNDKPELAQFLVQNYSSQVFYTRRWDFTVHMLNLIEALRDNGTKSMQNGAVCHLGKEPLHSGARFWMFRPPNNEQIAGYTQRLIETGVFRRLEKEGEGFLHSLRVQDENRVLSKTHVRSGRHAEKMKEQMKQQIEGKLWKVFLVWAACILACLIGMGLELAYNIKKKTKVMTLKPTSREVVKVQVALKWFEQPQQMR